MASLEQRWPRWLADEPQIRDRLLAAYAEEHRGYHDQRHLAEVFDRLDAVMPADFPERDAVILAAWFHDAIYETSDQAGNEERSAVLAERELATVHAPPRLVDEVARLVRLTATHTPADDDLAGQYLCDADLAILAAEPGRYADYLSGVRREYAEVGDADFAAGRRAILAALAAKPTLFHTEAARARWEQRARDNLRRELG